jgi:mRNA interferase MazF
VKRGDVVLAALPGDYGKPRPAVIVQSDLLNAEEPTSYILCPLTTTLTGRSNIRVPVAPSARNGLQAPSELMVDKVSAAPAKRIRETVGQLDAAAMRAIDRAVLLVLGIA